MNKIRLTHSERHIGAMLTTILSFIVRVEIATPEELESLIYHLNNECATTYKEEETFLKAVCDFCKASMED